MRTLFKFLGVVLLCGLPQGASAEDEVQLYGHVDCPPCVKIKRVLRERRIPFQSHDLRDPRVEQYYVRTFGRGRIPLAQVGRTVIRGDRVAEVLTAVKSRRRRPARSQVRTSRADRPSGLQTCENGLVLEDFFEAERDAAKRRAARGDLPGMDAIDIVLDRCYGARGKLLCGSREHHFRTIKRLGGSFELEPTYGSARTVAAEGCKLIRY